MNQELPDVLIGFRKGRGTKDKFPTFAGEKAREFLRNIYLCFINYAKAFDVWIMTKTNCGKLLVMGTPDHLTCLLRNLYMGQETTVRALYGTDWFKIERGV